jgi:hypothetical protein
MGATIALDWSRLLGFDQASVSGDATAARRLNDPRMARLGTKSGNKNGEKPKLDR